VTTGYGLEQYLVVKLKHDWLARTKVQQYLVVKVQLSLMARTKATMRRSRLLSA
jgi:hypothetical protein